MGVTDNQNPFGLIPLLNPIIGRDFFILKKKNKLFTIFSKQKKSKKK